MNFKNVLTYFLLAEILCFTKATVNRCAGFMNDTIAAVSSDCGAFIYCIDEKPFQMKCPDDLVYNPPFKGCDRSECVDDCGGRYLDCTPNRGSFGSEADCKEYY